MAIFRPGDESLSGKKVSKKQIEQGTAGGQLTPAASPLSPIYGIHKSLQSLHTFKSGVLFCNQKSLE